MNVNENPGIAMENLENKPLLHSLLNSDEKYFKLLNSLGEGIGFVNSNEIFEYTNSAADEIFETSPGCLLGKSVYDYIDESDFEKIENETNIRKQGKNSTYELKIRTEKGNEKTILLTATTGFDNNDNFLGTLGVFRDITEQKKIQDELLLKERAICSSINAMALFDLNENLIYVNPAFVKLWGYDSKEEVIGRKASDFCPQPKNYILIRGSVIKNGGWKGEMLGKRKDGSQFDIEISASIVSDSDGNPIYTLCFFLDITERKEAEKQLKESQLIYSIIANNTQDWVLWIDSDGKSLYHSPSCKKVTGYEVEDFMNNDETFLHKIIHPDDLHLYIQHRHDTLQEMQPGKIEFRIISKDGEIKWIEHICQPVFDPKGKFLGSRASNRDISERKMYEQKLIQKLKVEEIIANISSRFISVNSENLDFELDLALEHIATISSIDRSYLFLFTDDMLSASNTNEWCADGIEKQKNNLQQVPCTLMPWWMDKFSKSENIVITNINGLPQEAESEKSFLKSQSIKSLLAIPLIIKNKIKGFLGFDSVINYKEWTEEDILLLKLAGEIFANAIDRINKENALSETERKLITLINNLNGIVYRCRFDRNWTMEFISQGITEITGYSADDFIDNKVRTFNSIVHPEDQERLWIQWDDVLKRRDYFTEEYRIKIGRAHV